jgi:lysophospholipase L1-like esterase
MTQLASIGDSWLFDAGSAWYCLVSSLRKEGYDFKSFASHGRLLTAMASETRLRRAIRYLENPGARPPQALLIGGGGNDVAYEDFATSKPPPLFKMLVPTPQPGQDPLIEAEVYQFIDVELFAVYSAMIEALLNATTIPILIHAYDHPIPDGTGQHLGGPWLEPNFSQCGIDVATPAGLTLAAEIMRRLINRLNAMVARVAAAYPDRVHHINLTGTLAAHYGSADNYKLLWANELHPNEQGFDILGMQIANKLKAIGIHGANPDRSDRRDAYDEAYGKQEVGAN